MLTEVTNQDEDLGDDMAGFLQFWFVSHSVHRSSEVNVDSATCEKQIVTPGNSILYCSEA